MQKTRTVHKKKQLNLLNKCWTTHDGMCFFTAKIKKTVSIDG